MAEEFFAAGEVLAFFVVVAVGGEGGFDSHGDGAGDEEDAEEGEDAGDELERAGCSEGVSAGTHGEGDDGPEDAEAGDGDGHDDAGGGGGAGGVALLVAGHELALAGGPLAVEAFDFGLAADGLEVLCHGGGVLVDAVENFGGDGGFGAFDFELGVAVAAGDEAGVGRDFEGGAAVVAGDGGEFHGGFSVWRG